MNNAKNLAYPLLTIALWMAQGPLHAQLSWDMSGLSPQPPSLDGLAVGDLTVHRNNGSPALISTASACNLQGSSGGANAALAAFTGTLALEEGSTALQVTLTPEGPVGVVLNAVSFASRSTSTGPTAWTLRWSHDDFLGVLAEGTLLNNSTWSWQSVPSIALSATIEEPLTLRLYGYGNPGTASTGTVNWRLDDWTLDLNVVPIPEPATATGCGALAAFLLALGLRRKRRGGNVTGAPRRAAVRR